MKTQKIGSAARTIAHYLTVSLERGGIEVTGDVHSEVNAIVRLLLEGAEEAITSHAAPAPAPTLRDRFAMAAPEVPGWFIGPKLQRTPPIGVHCTEHSEEDREYGTAGSCDACARVELAWEMRNVEARKNSEVSGFARLTAWRYAYADAMLAARAEVPCGL